MLSCVGPFLYKLRLPTPFELHLRFLRLILHPECVFPSPAHFAPPPLEQLEEKYQPKIQSDIKPTGGHKVLSSSACPFLFARVVHPD